jgi:hypothetical protein
LLVFPQLRSGALAQLPLRRTESYRTLQNTLPDGSSVLMTDGGFANVAWDLKFSGLSANEAQALQSLFESAAGRLNTFTFVDPSANLLLWSTDLTQAAWSKDPELALTAVTDAFGGGTGTQIANQGAAAQSTLQTTNAPPSLQYCISAYLRSESPVPVSLAIGGNVAATVVAGNTWQRYVGTSVGGTGQQVVFGLTIPAGMTAQVCGLQAEAQPAAGAYKSTTGQPGVYPNSRFDQDSMNLVASEAGVFACNLRIVSQL